MPEFSLVKLKHLGIDTYTKPVIYMHKACHLCSLEGFEAESRILVTFGKKSVIATLNMVSSNIIKNNEAALSDYAIAILGVKSGDSVKLSHPKPLTSLSFVRSKIYGNRLEAPEISEIINDITSGLYSDVHISAFLTACANNRLNTQEIIDLTKSMVNTGQVLKWQSKMVVDKHCVGGLPGNRTSPIVVAIVAAFGLTMPKTSSRAITSPAGTADTMEVLAPVEMDLKSIKKVVTKENGCIVWGGNAALSPADDILIRIEKAMDLDSDAQLVASVLSKKIAAGSTHILIDIPIGPTAKVRSLAKAKQLKKSLILVGKNLGLKIKVCFTDGKEPIGFGIGPALEARDVMAVLENSKIAPKDLREKSLFLAAKIIEFSPKVKKGEGIKIATEILDSGLAYKKFMAICQMQGELRKIPEARYKKIIKVPKDKSGGKIILINNRNIAMLAKLAGAPDDKTAGVDLHVRVGDKVKKNQALFTVQAGSIGGLDYALEYIKQNPELIVVNKNE